MKAAFEVAEHHIGCAKLAGDPAERHGGIGDIHQIHVARQNNLCCHNGVLQSSCTRDIVQWKRGALNRVAKSGWRPSALPGRFPYEKFPRSIAILPALHYGHIVGCGAVPRNAEVWIGRDLYG